MREARTDAERAVETKLESRRPVVWRRLKEAGARANGLAGLSRELDPGQAVAKRFAGDVLDEAEARAVGEAFLVGQVGLDKDGDDRENRHDPDDGGYFPFEDAKRSAARENGEERCPEGAAEREGQERLVQGVGAFDDRHWIAFGDGSLRVTAFSACVLVLASALAPAGWFPGRWSIDGPTLGAGMYLFWLAGTFWAECRGCGRGIAVVPQSLRAVRFGLSMVALAFLWSGDPAAAGLAVWIAAAALAIGGFDDGGWIAVVSLRREVPPWRAVAAVFRESRDAWRAQWSALYGGTLR